MQVKASSTVGFGWNDNSKQDIRLVLRAIDETLNLTRAKLRDPDEKLKY